MSRRRRSRLAAPVVDLLRAPATPRELRDQDRAMAAFLDAMQVKRAQPVPTREVRPLPGPRRRSEPVPVEATDRRRGWLAAAGPLTAAAAVVAVAALAVPVLTGVFGREEMPPPVAADPLPTTASVRGSGSPSASGAPGPTSPAAVATTVPSPTGSTSAPAQADPVASPSRGVEASRRTVRGGDDGSTTLVTTRGGSTSSAGNGSAPRPESNDGRAPACRAWLLVQPDTPPGGQLLNQLSDGRSRRSHAADIAAVDRLCRDLVGKDPPRCRSDGTPDPTALASRPLWAKEPLYGGWCLGVTGHGDKMCGQYGCPPVWWRCPTWGCTGAWKGEESAPEGTSGSSWNPYWRGVPGAAVG